MQQLEKDTSTARPGPSECTVAVFASCKKVSWEAEALESQLQIIPARPQPGFLGHLGICMGHFWVRRGLKMILSHRAPSSLNKSSYRPIWTHFRQNSIFFINLILQLLASATSPRQIHHTFTTDPPQIHERCIIIRFTIGSR